MSSTIPNYIKYFFIMANMIITFYILWIGQSIFKPLVAAAIVAILLVPLTRLLERLKIPSLLCCILSVIILILLIFSILLVIGLQLTFLSTDMDKISSGLNLVLDHFQHWFAVVFGFSPSKQILFLKENSADVFKKITGFVPDFIGALSYFFAEFVFFIITLFFFLYYRYFLLQFLFNCFKNETHSKFNKIITSVQQVVRKYIFGVFLVILIVGILNIMGLSLLGIDNAILFGSIAGILTIIPYIGVLIGALLPVLFTLVTMHSLWYAFGVMGVLSLVQFLEGNFITPNIISSQTSLNPLAGLLALFISGKFFGILGIILALPCLAILKVIADYIKPLQPFNYLIGSPKKIK